MQMKVDPIDTELQYPCPRCRQGKLCPITLTEALGCQACQKIFVIRADGYTIEQLSTQISLVWRWDGRQWRAMHHRWSGRSVLLASLLGAMVLVLVGLIFASFFNLESPVLWWILIACVVAVILSVVLLFRAHRY